MPERETFPFLSSSNPLKQIQEEASRANLMLLKDSRSYLDIREISACMLAWFSFQAEFYRESDHWFVRGGIPDSHYNRQKLNKYFNPENITKTENGEICYCGSLTTQEDLTSFVSDIKAIISI